jgi:hypothetical protein
MEELISENETLRAPQGRARDSFIEAVNAAVTKLLKGAYLASNQAELNSDWYR